MSFELRDPFGEGTSNVSTTSRACKLLVIVENMDGYLFLICAVTSISILVLLSYLQRRRSLCLDCCWARPSLPVPMDFLVSPFHRLPYILVFTLLAADMLSTIVFSSSLLTQNVSVYVDIIIKIVIIPFLIVLLLGLKYFPLLACVQASSQRLGHCLGLAYSMLWFVVKLVDTVYRYYLLVCNYGQGSTSLSSAQVVGYLFQYVPLLLISLAVVCWYLFHVITCRVAPEPKQGVRDYQLLHVKNLLSRSCSIPVMRGRLTALLIEIGHYFVPYNKYVKLPLPFLCIVVAMAGFLYQLSFIVILQGIDLLEELSVVYKELQSSFNITRSVDDILSGFLIGLPVLIIISPFVSLGLCAFLLLHMVGSISKMVKATARQGFTEKLPAMVARVPAFWTYLGIQMGLFAYAWTIFSLVVFLLGFAAIAMYLGLKYFTNFFLYILFLLIFPVLWSNGMFYLQYLICKFVFYEDSSGKFISIKHQHLFNWFAYLLFLYNGFAGFAKAITRVVITACISLLLLFRLDTIILAHGFEFFDSGHKAFLGFFYLNHCYNNAVVHTFIHLLGKESDNSQKHSDVFYGDAFRLAMKMKVMGNPKMELWMIQDLSSHRPISYQCWNCENAVEALLENVKKRARNRWLVAYTLLRNPSLRKLTARNLAVEKMVNLQPAPEDVGVKFPNSSGQ